MSVSYKQFHWRSRSSSWLFGLAAVIAGGLLGLVINQVSNPIYIWAGAIAVFAFALTVTSLEWGLLALVFITYTRLSDIAVHFHNAPSIAKSFIVLLVVAIFIRWAIFHERPMGWQRAFALIGLYGLVGFTSLLYAANPLRTGNAISDFLKDAVIAIIITSLLYRASTLRRVIWTLLLVALLMGSLSIYQYLTGTFENQYWGLAQTKYMNIVGETQGYRISGPIGDPNFFAMIMVALVPFGFERLIHEKKWWLRLLALLALVISVLTVIFTFSRGGFVALVVTILATLFVFPPRPKYLPIIIVAILVVVLLLPVEYTSRIFTLTDVVSGLDTGIRTQDLSLRGRASESISAWLMFEDHPFLGVGWNNFSLHYQEYARRVGLSPTAGERAAHNLYLEIAAETGLVGIGVFSLLLIVMLRGVAVNARKLRTAGKYQVAGMAWAVFLSLIGYLSASMFVHGAYPRFFWLLVGIAFSIPNLSKHELNDIKNNS
jgi:O-antigen ligase